MADFRHYTIKDWMMLAVLMLIVIGVGMFAVNQSLSYFYKAEFLKSPCSLCEELNPHLEKCFQDSSMVKVENPNNNYYNLTFNYP
jgi:hypothetical protein